MAEARLLIHRAGAHVALQDGGRPGLMRFGVTASGPMDRPALALANAALGQPQGALAIEVSPLGLELELDGAALTFALAGGGFIADISEGRRSGSWHVFTLHPGDRLAIRPGHWGNWCVLAPAGQIAAPRWLGSAATNTALGLGGGSLSAGQELAIHAPRAEPWRDGPIPCPVWARPTGEVQVVLGPQDRYFAPDVIETFLTSPFTLTPAQDRMGSRLRGPDLRPQGALAIPSEAVLRGAVQVSGDGVASVLLADHQTTGGYPKIATLAGPETDRFAQNRAGDVIRFRAITPEAALHLTRQRARSLATCVATLSSRTPGSTRR